ncbi:MAG TPA: ABC transporter ATP-binding protein [Terriglobales bacterium]|jgi:ATP-binding cassette subfamily B multidrug efflux pump|nr:ABC transporter ATP-binding protein [Terriglobales bacterium]
MANIHEEEALGKAYDSRLMKRLLTYLRPYKWQVAVALVTIVLKATADALGPLLTIVAVDTYLAPKLGAPAARYALTRWLSPDPLVGVAQIGGLYVFLLCFSFFLEFAQTYYMQWTGQKVMFDLRSQIFRHLQQMHVGFFDKNPVGRLVTRVTTDVDALNEMFTAGVVSIIEDVFVLFYIVFILLRMKWWLGLITLSVLPLIFIATMMFRRSVRESYRRIRTAIARINAFMQEHVSGIVVLQLFNREKRAYERFIKINAAHMDAFKDAILAHAIYYPVVEILSSLAIASIIWFGGGGVIRNAVTIGILTGFMQYAQRFFRPIQDLSEKYNILQGAMASSERIFKLLDTKSEIVSPTSPKEPQGTGRIEFDHVWFAYRNVPLKEEAEKKPPAGSVRSHDGKAGELELKPGDPDWVLQDVSFAIEPGETVAIVGHTGAGKTTILSLLLRFYDVQRGAVRIDGVDVREMDLDQLRRNFGMVLQDPFLFTGTIEQNIRLGSHWVTAEAVQQAAEKVNVADFIRTLPAGFQEAVRERGTTLSTGQKQLISFARALAHDPKVLILDEATSSVDTETEFRVRDALSRMIGTEGRTSVIVAHRLSTIQRADKIIVMHKGRVREIGNHQQLLSRRGIYWKLYQLQYKDQEIPLPAAARGAERLVGADD